MGTCTSSIPQDHADEPMKNQKISCKDELNPQLKQEYLMSGFVKMMEDEFKLERGDLMSTIPTVILDLITYYVPYFSGKFNIGNIITGIIALDETTIKKTETVSLTPISITFGTPISSSMCNRVEIYVKVCTNWTYNLQIGYVSKLVKVKKNDYYYNEYCVDYKYGMAFRVRWNGIDIYDGKKYAEVATTTYRDPFDSGIYVLSIDFVKDKVNMNFKAKGTKTGYRKVGSDVSLKGYKLIIPTITLSNPGDQVRLLHTQFYY